MKVPLIALKMESTELSENKSKLVLSKKHQANEHLVREMYFRTSVFNKKKDV